MSQSLLSKYETGVITADHLIVECLLQMNPKNPEALLDELPSPILERMLAFTEKYESGPMVSNYGVLPAPEQVRAARKWIEDCQTTREGRRSFRNRANAPFR